MTTLRTSTTTSTLKPIATQPSNDRAQRSGAAATTLEEIALDFTERLLMLVESASKERGEELIASIFSGLGDTDHSRLGKAAQKQAARERRQLVDLFTRRLTDAIDKSMQARVRDLLDRGISGPAADKQAGAANPPSPNKPAFPDLTASGPKVRRQVRRRPLSFRPRPPLIPSRSSAMPSLPACGFC